MKVPLVAGSIIHCDNSVLWLSSGVQTERMDSIEVKWGDLAMWAEEGEVCIRQRCSCALTALRGLDSLFWTSTPWTWWLFWDSRMIAKAPQNKQKPKLHGSTDVYQRWLRITDCRADKNTEYPGWIALYYQLAVRLSICSEFSFTVCFTMNATQTIPIFHYHNDPTYLGLRRSMRSILLSHEGSISAAELPIRVLRGMDVARF